MDAIVHSAASVVFDAPLPQSENQKFVLEGNPAKKLRYRVTRKSNTRIADFVLATHPEEETTEYWRIRAFGDQAEKVRDQVEVGQNRPALHQALHQVRIKSCSLCLCTRTDGLLRS